MQYRHFRGREPVALAEHLPCPSGGPAPSRPALSGAKGSSAGLIISAPRRAVGNFLHPLCPIFDVGRI